MAISIITSSHDSGNPTSYFINVSDFFFCLALGFSFLLHVLLIGGFGHNIDDGLSRVDLAPVLVGPVHVRQVALQLAGLGEGLAA